MTYTTTQTRTNLVKNPSLETNTTDWVAVGTGTTIARITSDAYVGSACVQVNKGAVVLGRIQNGYGASTRIPVTAGVPYTFSAYVKVPSGQPSCSLRIRTREFVAAGTNQQSQVSSTVTVSDSDGWVRLSLTDTPLANTVNMDWAIEEITANARVYLVDAAIVEQSSTLRPYFDGSTAETYSGYTLTAQAWTGTANASTSVTHWGLTSTYVNNGVARFNNSFRDTQAFRQYVEVPNYAPRKVIYFASPFSNTQGFYRGITVYSRTATGSGTGTQSATRIRVKLRTASASATGTAQASGLHVAPRTATGSGSGSSSTLTVLTAKRTAIGASESGSVAEGEHVAPRGATGSGQGSTADTAVGLHIAPRTATGLGVGSASATGLVTRAFTASASGTGSATAVGLHVAPRTATGSGTGSSTSAGVSVRGRFGTDSAAGSSTAVAVRVLLRTVFKQSLGASEATGLHIAPRTATGSGTSTQTSVGARLTQRTATGSGVGAQSAISVKLFIFRTPTENFPSAPYRNGSIANRLFSYAGQGSRGRNVYKLTNGTFTEAEQRDATVVSKVYHGGHANTVTQTEKDELVAAGYGSYIT